MRQNKTLYLRFILCILLIINGLYSIAHDVDKTETVIKYQVKERRNFTKLETSFVSNEMETAFFDDPSFQIPSFSDSLKRQSIQASFNKVVSENRFITFLDEHALMDLPVGLRKEIGNLVYVIMIDSAIITANETLLFASMSFEAPGLGKLEFQGAGIFSGSGGIKGGRLNLVGDYSLPKKGANQLIIKGSNQRTYVEFDCNGYVQMSLDASMKFSRNLIQPVNDAGEVEAGKNVSIDFYTSLIDWNDLIVAASLPAFQIKGLEGFIFEVQEAVLDLSDLQNAPGVAFPVGYAEVSPYLKSGSPALWRGVFIKSLSITLPAQFSSREGKGVSFVGANMLIDDIGFSGIVSAKNLIPLEKGKIGNWNFSLDELSIPIVANAPKGAGFKGYIDIPINEHSCQSTGDAARKSLFGYAAVIKPGNNYQFIVTNPDVVNFSLWKAADVQLDKASFLEVRLEGQKFEARAHLNGNMTINAGLSGEDGAPEADQKKNVTLANVRFENLNVQTVKPYVTVGYFSLGLPSRAMGGFPITINKIEGGQTATEIFLGVDVTLHLTGSSDGGFGAGGGFRLYSGAVENGDELSYKYKRLEINRFEIDIDNGKAFSFTGNLNFYKGDRVYGNGLSGTINATFAESFKM